MNELNLKRTFFWVIITSLSISAIFGIFVFLSGSFGETEERILITSLALGGYCLTGLCAAIWYDKKMFLPLSYTGILISGTGFLYSVLCIWDIIDIHSTQEAILLVIIILSVSLSHASLVLVGYNNKNKTVNKIIIVTLGSSVILTLLLIAIVTSHSSFSGDFTEKAIGIFSILTALGTFLVPILYKMLALTDTKYDVYMVCPTNRMDESQVKQLVDYIKKLEMEGKKVYCPLKDDDQNDYGSNKMYLNHKNIIMNSKEIHIWWIESSEEIVFDLGIAWGLSKRLIIANAIGTNPGQTKSFLNLITWWNQQNNISGQSHYIV